MSILLALQGPGAPPPPFRAPDALPIPRFRMPQGLAVSFNLNLIGQDALPVGSQSLALARGVPGTSWIRTWTQSLNILGALATIPVGASHYTVPARFPATSWPTAWTNSYNLNLIGQDALPIGASAYETPKRFPATSWPTAWTNSYNLNLIGQDILPPGRQLAEPMRGYFYPPDLRTSVVSLVRLLGLPPIAQYDWPLPVAPWRSPSLRTWVDPVKLNLIGQDAMAPGAQSYELARGVPGTSWIRTWAWYSLPIVPPNPVPLNQYDWPLPVAPRPAQQLRTWAAPINLNLVGKDAMAPGQIYDKLARGSPPPVPSWTQWFPLSLIGQDTLPIRQSDWPLPSARPLFQALPISFPISAVAGNPFAQYDWPLPAAQSTFRVAPIANVLPLVTIRPFAQYDWPVPIARTSFRPAPIAFAVSLNLTRPFAQYDWPLPVAPSYPANLRTAAGLDAQQLAPITIPVGRSSYELTGRPPHPVSLRSYTLSLGPQTSQASTPFRQTDWPLPTPRRYAVQLRTWIDPVRLNLLGQDTRFFVYDRPLPRRQPEPDHSFVYSRFPGLIPTNFAVCAHTEVTSFASSTRVSSTESATDVEAAATSTTKFASC